MNIIEAVKSGRPFKRKAWDILGEWMAADSWSKAFLKADILAEDWEIHESTITITSAQFWDAAKAACPRLVLDGVLVSSEFIALANKLGLDVPGVEEAE